MEIPKNDALRDQTLEEIKADLHESEKSAVIVGDFEWALLNIETLRQLSEINNKIKFIPLNTRVFSLLSSKRIGNILPYWEFCSSQLLKNTLAIKGDFWRKWYAEIGLAFEVSGVDLLYADDSQRSWFYEDYVYLYLLLDKILFTEKFQHVVLAGKETRRLPEFVEAEDTPYFVLFELQKKLGFKTHLLRESAEEVPQFNKAIRQLATASDLPQSPIPKSHGQKRMAILLPGLKDNREIFTAANLLGMDVHPIRSTYSDPDHYFTGSNPVRGIGADPAFKTPEKTMEQVRALWVKFKDARTQLEPQFFFANESLDPLFENIFLQRLPHLYNATVTIEKYLENMKFDYSIICDHCFPETYIYFKLAQKMKSTTLISPHSCWPIHTDPWVGASAVAVWNELSKKEWGRQYDSQFVHVLGSPRFGFDRDLKKQAEEKKRAAGKFRILYITNAAEYSYRPMVDPKGYMNSLQKFFAIPKSLRNRVEIKVKIKPSFESAEFFREMIKVGNNGVTEDLDIEILEDGDLNQLSASSDLVVAVDLLSTGHLEALFLNRPVLVIKDAASFYKEEPLLPDDVFLSLSASSIWSTIGEMIENPELQQQILRRQIEWFEKEHPKGRYVDRLAGLLSQTESVISSVIRRSKNRFKKLTNWSRVSH